MPSCIITGATGFIGSHLTQYLYEQGWEISIISRPHSNYNKINNILSNIDVFEYDGSLDKLILFFRQKKADIVMHLAAAIIYNPTPGQISQLVKGNIEFGTDILEAMRYSSSRMFINTGSYWQNYNSATYNPVDLYSATKEAFEKILHYYVDAHGFRAITLRLFDVYGEDDTRPKLWNFLKTIAGTDEVIDISKGEQLLDMVYIRDVVRAYECAYLTLNDHPEVKNEIFGVYTGDRRSLREIVELFQSIIEKPIKLNWGARPYKQREVMKPYEGYKVLDNWSPEVSLEAGFKKFKS